MGLGTLLTVALMAPLGWSSAVQVAGALAGGAMRRGGGWQVSLVRPLR